MREECKQRCLELCKELNKKAIEEVKKSDTNVALVSLALRCNEFTFGLSSQIYSDSEQKGSEQ